MIHNRIILPTLNTNDDNLICHGENSQFIPQTSNCRQVNIEFFFPPIELSGSNFEFLPRRCYFVRIENVVTKKISSIKL